MFKLTVKMVNGDEHSFEPIMREYLLLAFKAYRKGLLFSHNVGCLSINMKYATSIKWEELK